MGSSQSNSKNLTPRPRKKFDRYYEIGNKIGCGAFARVNKCNLKKKRRGEGCKEAFAVKTINKQFLNQEELLGLRHEILILKKLDHENCVKLKDVFDDGRNVQIVLELCDGKDLFDMITKSKSQHLNEKEAAIIVYHMANALQYLHSKNIVHRDIKPENILFTKDGVLKLTDFGLSNHSESSSTCIRLHSCCGTPSYVAPEVITQLKGGYGAECDLWSLGVLLYIMLVGFQPFNADSLTGVYELIAKADYNFKHIQWLNVSDEAKDLIQCLMCIDVDKRYKPKQIFQHPFIKKHVDLCD